MPGSTGCNAGIRFDAEAVIDCVCHAGMGIWVAGSDVEPPPEQAAVTNVARARPTAHSDDGARNATFMLTVVGAGAPHAQRFRVARASL